MMIALHRLTNANLRNLATALRSGRLAPPYREIAVGAHCPQAEEASVTTQLNHFSGDGLRADHIAIIAESIIAARSQSSEADQTHLVWSGPDAPGITNRDTGVVVRELFGTATSEVLIAGYAVYQGRDIFRRLAERMAEIATLEVRFFLDIRRSMNDPEPASVILRRFADNFRMAEWPGDRLPAMYYDPRSLADQSEQRSSLHAKCIVVDRRVAFVSSANFTEAAQLRNIEVGALIKSASFAEQLRDHFEKLLAGGLLLRLSFMP